MSSSNPAGSRRDPRVRKDGLCAETTGQLEFDPEPRCPHCGPLGWTQARYGATLHKHSCPDHGNHCQAHPIGCDNHGDQRGLRVTQLTELPGETFEEIFVCPMDAVDESAGMKDEAA